MRTGFTAGDRMVEAYLGTAGALATLPAFPTAIAKTRSPVARVFPRDRVPVRLDQRLGPAIGSPA